METLGKMLSSVSWRIGRFESLPDITRDVINVDFTPRPQSQSNTLTGTETDGTCLDSDACPLLSAPRVRIVLYLSTTHQDNKTHKSKKDI